MKSEAFLSLLQFTDGLFPAGAYAHSFGLETYFAAGVIRDAAGVQAFLLSYLQGSVAPTDAVAALSSGRAALSGQVDRMQRCNLIDLNLDAMKLAGELRDASRQMGRQVLRIAAGLGGAFALQGLTADLLKAIDQGKTPGHHAMAFGVIGAALGWPEKEMACAYLYSSCAGLTAAAVRLLSLGQSTGQRIVWALAPSIATLASEIHSKEFADVWSFAPGIEIASMRHAMLDARLFRS